MKWVAVVLVVAAITASGAVPSGERVVFEGNTSYSRAALLRALRYFNVAVDGDFGVTDADDAAYFLRQYYFDHGFPDAEVRYEYFSNPPRAVFRVDEGGQVFLGAIGFSGSEAISESRLREVVVAAVRQATLSPFGRLRYVPAAIAKAHDELETVFVQEGYLDASVDLEQSPTVGNSVSVDFRIRQGPKYELRTIKFEGLTVPDAKALAILDVKLPTTFYPATEARLRTRLVDFLRNQGFYRAEVSGWMNKDPAAGTVGLVLTATPGPQYTVEEVQVTGATRTREGSILSKYPVKPGVVYNAGAVDDAAQRLWRTGGFVNVETKIEELPGHRLRVVLSVQETKARHIETFVGYGQWERAFANVTYTDSNFLGTLTRLELTGYISQRAYALGATLSDPWFLGTVLTGEAGLFVSRRELPAYQATEYGASVGVLRRPETTKMTGYQLQLAWRAVTNSEVFGDSELPLTNYRVGTLVFRQTLDRRNDMLVPMQGYLLQYESGIAAPALLGELSYLRFAAQGTAYFPLEPITREKPFVPFFIVNHRVGLILPYANTGEVPVQERFFLGGPDTVRSFQIDGLGPRDSDGDPLGGQAYVLGNLELQWPAFRSFYVAGFVDAGNLAPSVETIQVDQTAVALGAGARVYTPIGALRVDYGYNLIRRTGDPVGAWQFGFGFSF